MSSIDRFLKQCICHKIELVRNKINNNLNLTHCKEMEAEGGPSVITVSNTVEPRFAVIFLGKSKLFLILYIKQKDYFNLMRFKNTAHRALISKNLMLLKTAILTLHFWCSPQKNILGQQKLVWAKIFRRVEELENFIINFTVYLRKLTNGWNLFHKSFFLCPSFCKESLFLKIFLILKKCFMSSIDRVLKLCVCQKI